MIFFMIFKAECVIVASGCCYTGYAGKFSIVIVACFSKDLFKVEQSRLKSTYSLHCGCISQNIESLHIADIFLRGIIELDVVLVEHVSLSFSSVGFFQTEGV